MSNRPKKNGSPPIGLFLTFCVAGIGLLKLLQAVFPSVSATAPVGPTYGDLELQDDCLPEVIGEWQKDRFTPAPAPETLEKQPPFWTQSWEYQRGGSVALVSFDQANSFNGWHELSECYTANGWTLESRKICDDENDWPYVVSRFTKSPNMHNIIVFSLFFDDGTAVSPPELTIDQARNRDMTMFEKLGRRATRSSRTDRSRQCQVLVAQSEPVSEGLEKQAVSLHLATRASVLSHWLKQAKD